MRFSTSNNSFIIDRYGVCHRSYWISIASIILSLDIFTFRGRIILSSFLWGMINGWHLQENKLFVLQRSHDNVYQPVFRGRMKPHRRRTGVTLSDEDRRVERKLFLLECEIKDGGSTATWRRLSAVLIEIMDCWSKQKILKPNVFSPSAWTSRTLVVVVLCNAKKNVIMYPNEL